MTSGDNMTDKDIKQAAKEIDDAASRYHLTHAVFAANVRLRSVFKEYSEKCILELRKKLLIAKQRKDNAEVEYLLQQIGELRLPRQIFINISDMNEGSGRALRVGNRFIIYVPRIMADSTIKTDGTFDAERVRALRRLMAHELGHIILHTNVLLAENSEQGTKSMNNDMEREAYLFADELLRLRHERNKKLALSDAV